MPLYAKPSEGILLGHKRECASNPCLNSGKCVEHYDHATCDCRLTAFQGPNCLEGTLGAVSLCEK